MHPKTIEILEILNGLKVSEAQPILQDAWKQTKEVEQKAQEEAVFTFTKPDPESVEQDSDPADTVAKDSDLSDSDPAKGDAEVPDES